MPQITKNSLEGKHSHFGKHNLDIQNASKEKGVPSCRKTKNKDNVLTDWIIKWNRHDNHVTLH